MDAWSTTFGFRSLGGSLRVAQAFRSRMARTQPRRSLHQESKACKHHGILSYFAMARRVVNRTKSGRSRGNEEVEIVLIDQAPLRRSVASQCSAAMARLEKVRIGWHQFEREDRPAL